VPGYLEKQAALKAAGIDEVLVYCVNDGAVMKAWAANQGVEGSMITFLADTRRELTEALGMVMTHPGPLGVSVFLYQQITDSISFQRSLNWFLANSI
jgi:peroxiredoxin